MRLLLDTHVLLWWLTDDPKLPASCAELIEDPTGGDALAADIGPMAERSGISVLPLTLAHALLAGALPLPHRDPFDRLLAAQAQLAGYVMLSADAAFDELGTQRTW